MKPFKHEIQKKKWDKLRKRKLITGIAIGGACALTFSGIGVGVGYIIWHNSKTPSNPDVPGPVAKEALDSIITNRTIGGTLPNCETTTILNALHNINQSLKIEWVYLDSVTSTGATVVSNSAYGYSGTVTINFNVTSPTSEIFGYLHGVLIDNVPYDGSSDEPYIQLTSSTGTNVNNQSFVKVAGDIPGGQNSDGSSLLRFSSNTTDGNGRIYFTGEANTEGNGDVCIQISGITVSIFLQVQDIPQPVPTRPSMSASLHGDIVEGTDPSGGPSSPPTAWIELQYDNFTPTSETPHGFHGSFGNGTNTWNNLVFSSQMWAFHPNDYDPTGVCLLLTGIPNNTGTTTLTITDEYLRINAIVSITISAPPPTPGPTSLIIDGVDSSGDINISTILNQEGEYQFYCHDNMGTLVTDATWQITSTVPDGVAIALDSDGKLTWGNNLDIDTDYSYSVKCSKVGLTDATCTIDLIVNQTPGNDVCPYSWFDVTADGVLSLKAGKDKNNIRNLVIPSQLDGITVSSIADEAFADCLYLNSLTLPNTLTSIGFKAFDKCSSITSLALTQNNIGTPIYQLVDGTTGNYVTDGSIQTNAFLVKATDAESGKIACTTNKDASGNNGSGIATKTLTIPATIDGEDLTMIDGSAFNDCSNIVSLTIASSNLEIIGGDAFRLCSSLEYIDLGQIQSVGEDAFAYCPKIREFLYERTTTAANDNDLVAVDKDGNFILSGKIDLINGGFLTEYKYSLPASYDNGSDTGGFGLNCSSKLAFGSITLPSVAKYIGDGSDIEGNGAFRNALSIHSIIIGDTVESIHQSAFENCTSLASLIFLPTTKEIWILREAFNRCTSLTTVTLPETIREIGRWAFSSCTSLFSINISSSNNNFVMRDYVLDGCTKLGLIIIKFNTNPQSSTPFSFDQDAFSGIGSTGVLENKGTYNTAIDVDAGNNILGFLQSHGLPNTWTYAN